jgi:hypothetical protein
MLRGCPPWVCLDPNSQFKHNLNKKLQLLMTITYRWLGWDRLYVYQPSWLDTSSKRFSLKKSSLMIHTLSTFQFNFKVAMILKFQANLCNGPQHRKQNFFKARRVFMQECIFRLYAGYNIMVRRHGMRVGQGGRGLRWLDTYSGRQWPVCILFTCPPTLRGRVKRSNGHGWPS